MKTQIKSFRLQFTECSETGFTPNGDFLKFKDHPELLPAPWHKAAKVVAELLEKDPEEGLQTISCGRFGGTCNSSHPDCRKLRESHNIGD